MCRFYRKIHLVLGALIVVVDFAHAQTIWRVENVEEGFNLNVRKGPSTEFDVVAELPTGTEGVRNFGCIPNLSPSEWNRLSERERTLVESMRWCRIEYNGVFGWVAARYIGPTK